MNFLSYPDQAKRLLLAVAMTAALGLFLNRCAAQSSQAEVVQDDQANQVEALIIELGDSSFSVRQRAMERLWEMGDEAKEILRSFTASADAEVASRAKRILEHLEYGIRPDMSAEIAAAIYSFHKSDVNQQYLILERLVKDGQFALSLDLIASIEDISHRYSLMMQAFPEGETLTEKYLQRAPLQEFEPLDELMNHRLMWEYHSGDCATYFAVRNLTSDRIANLVTETAEENRSDNVRHRLIAHYRMNGDFFEAARMASDLAESAEKYQKAILIEAGEWTEASSQKPEQWELELQSAAENLLLCYWSDDKERFRGRRNELYQNFPVPQHADRLANLHLLTMDTDWLVKNVDSFDRAFGFQFLCHLHRFDEAFAMAQVPDGLEERKLWYQSEVSQLQEYIQRIIRQLDVDDRAARSQFEFCLEFASVIGSLGNVEESLQYFDILIEGIKWKDDEFFQAWNESIFEQLCRLDLGPKIWTYLLALGMDRSSRQVYSYLFPDARLQAIFWQSVLQEEYPDPVVRMRFIATLVRSPFSEKQPIDVQRLASIARESLEKMPIRMRRNQLLALADTLEIHGLEKAAKDLRVESGHLGHIAAFEALARHAAEKESWDEAASWYRQAIQIGIEPHLMKYSYQLALKHDDSADYDENQLVHSLLCTLNSSDWIKFTDRSSELQDNEMAAELLGMYLRSSDLLEPDTDYYKRHLAELLKDHDPVRSTILYRQASYSYFRILFGGEFPNIAFHQLSTEIHFGEVRTLIAEGRYDEAMELLRQFAGFVSGNSELAEEFVPVLVAAGRLDEADELFGLIANRYLRVLDSYPNSATHHNNYAWVSARCNRNLDDALLHAEKAVELIPDHTSYMDTLAEVCFRRGETERALELAKRCVELNPYKPHYGEQVIRFEQALSEN